MSDHQKIVVVGNGMVGHKFIEQMLTSSAEQGVSVEISIFAEEPRVAYDRVHLSAFFDGKTADDLSLTTLDFYRENGVNVILGDAVVAMDKDAMTVTSQSGKTVTYDKLVLATGSYPFVPPIPGHDQEHCLVYRTIEDLEQITSSAKLSKTGVVVGGGLLGLEAANALQNLGLETHVVEFAPGLMSVQLDEGGSAMLKRKIEALGVRVHCGKNTQNIASGESYRYRMEFADGSHLETDMILFSAGIRPRDNLARQYGIDTGERGGIVIDNNCLTSDSNVYAVGECALWDNKIYGLVAPGYQMSQTAVDHILGSGSSEFAGADMSTKLKLLGVDVASVGDAQANTEGAQSYVFIDEQNESYKKLVIDAEGKRVLGAVLVGDAEAYGNLQQMMLNNMDLPEQPEALILPNVDGGSSVLGVDALPDAASICSCNDVSKGDICTAVADGSVCDVSTLKSCTKAGTSCGGCAVLAKQVMDSELTKLGVEVNTDLCEHFPHTRQEMEHLIRIGKIKTWTDMLHQHGTGAGCDICKPTVASILATTWNEHVLEPKLAVLQDTNDYFLGNMQKDGTYSVVPRIPGGEITPDKLIVLGEVANKYNLYTKITGGQRIDLFGAQVGQLPDIWRELIDAGFETGQAYGKSVRTVKSCVGSTWCRYGVQDSVGMAIDVENRYRGIRSPHKLKFAVSGCTRECAEAQSKDVGVIATENGWNLYVCGNGGMKPRHADLLASDIDDETLIKYIDRFLIFYIRTAERLQRTSVWMDNLEGGLEYLKQVVCEDSLGLAEELEAQMEMLVDTFQCEWKTTIEDPEKMKRFRHFVNSDKQDDNVLFVEERKQIRPATEEEKAELIATQVVKTGEAA